MVRTDICMKARWHWKTMERRNGIMSENTNTTKRRSAIQIMGSLIGLVKPLLHIMLASNHPWNIGLLCAIFLTILAGQVIMHGLLTGVAGMIVPVDNMWRYLPSKNDYYSHDRNCSASWNPALCGTVL